MLIAHIRISQLTVLEPNQSHIFNVSSFIIIFLIILALSQNSYMFTYFPFVTILLNVPINFIYLFIFARKYSFFYKPF